MIYILNKDKLPAMYRRLFDVMKGNGYHETAELDDSDAVEKMTRTFRLTKEDMKGIIVEIKKMDQKR